MRILGCRATAAQITLGAASIISIVCEMWRAVGSEMLTPDDLRVWLPAIFLYKTNLDDHVCRRGLLRAVTGRIHFGTKGSFSLLVQPEYLADRFKDAILPPVFATLVMVMENTALNAIRACLDPGESAVGTAVNVRHLAAPPLGCLVSGEAEVTKVCSTN